MPERRATAGRWPALFVFALVVLAVSVAVLILAIASAGGSDDQDSKTSVRGPAGVPTAVGTPTARPAGSVQALPTHTPVPAGGTLPCGDILVPIDKERALAPDCAPTDLVALPAEMSYQVDFAIQMRAEATTALKEMFEAARKDGYTLVVRSAYRSYQQQIQTFDANVAAGGLEYAQRTSARAGHSEHQLGTAADITSASNGYGLEGFERTKEAKWLAANAVKYGFVLSFPEGKEAITGYAYEPWHFRYVGKDVAAKIQASGLTPREYLLR
jgi:D-alanyl-D-alanine carboxypeptidase